jgi:hypothetical protein
MPKLWAFFLDLFLICGEDYSSAAESATRQGLKKESIGEMEVDGFVECLVGLWCSVKASLRPSA